MSVETERLYLESFAQPLTKNTWLTGAVMVLAVALVGSVAVNFYAVNSAHAKRPYVVRIDSLGRAEAVDSEGFKYAPQESEVRYFLGQFVTLYYTRNRYTIGSKHGGLADSLYFFDDAHRAAVEQQWAATQIIKKFLTDPTSPQVSIEPKQVSIMQLNEPPYQARVDFEEQSNQTPSKMFTATIVFSRLQSVPAEMTAVNPLGFMVQEIHTEEYLH
jgi:type IV secretory pathway component VirB8